MNADPYTMAAKLCDDDGIVRSDDFGHYPCTGHAHADGEHIRCTSPAHRHARLVDALLERPERIEDPLPEELERLLRDPEIYLPEDRLVLEVIREQLRRDPEARVTREAFLMLFRHLEEAEASA